MASQVQKVQSTAKRFQTNFATVDIAARRYHVPTWILWGVYGIETDFGQNVQRSSAGAEGPFQFLPSTGKSYGLNSRTIQQLGPSADAAAKYLRDLFNTYGSWDAALHHYSGGGYGQDAVHAKAFSNVSVHLKDTGRLLPNVNVPNPVKSIQDAIQNLVAPLGAIANFFQGLGELLLNPRRFLKMILGGVLLLWGVEQLSKAMTGVSPIGKARSIGTKAAMAAAL